MFKNNNIKKIKNKRFKISKKMILIILPVVVILGVIALITTGSLSKLMGNSISSYHCIDDTWKLEGTTCSKTTTKKAELFADINLDSKIDNSDLELLNYYIENNNKVDYTILSNIQLVLADINGDGTIDNFDSGMLEYYITNPDKQSKDMVCEKEFKLNGSNCELEENIPAEVDDNSVGASNNQVVSFGYANFYKTYVGNTNIYVETSIPSEIVSEYIGTLNKLNTEYSGYLTSISNLFLISDKIYAEVEGDSGGVSLPAINSIFIRVYDNCCGDGSWVKQTIRHETGHRIDDATNKVIGTPLFEMQYNGHNIKYYTEKYYKAKLCDGDFCLRYAPYQGNYSYGESYWEFFADVFASFDDPALKVNDELKIVRDEVKQKFHDIYSKNSDKFKEIQNKYKNIYMINYSADSGYGNIKPQIAVYNESTKLNSNVFTKDNYVFDGWKLERSNGTWLCYTDANKINISWTNESFCKKYDYVRLKDGANVIALTQPDSYVTLHVAWKKTTNEQTSLINYVVVNDDNTYKTIATQKVPFGTSSLKPYSYKSNLKFAGWHAKRSDGYGYCYIDSDKKKASWVNQSTCNLYDYELLKDQQPFYNYSTNYSYTLEAQFNDYKFDVKFDGNGATKGSMKSYNYYTAGECGMNSLPSNEFENKGYGFWGWYADTEDGRGYCYTSYDKTDVAWSDKNACSRFGHKLISDHSSNNRAGICEANNNVILKAQWANTFTLKFDGNGATKGSMKDQKIVYGVPTSIHSNEFKKTGYVFLGWHAKRDDGKGYCYTNSAKTKKAWSSKETCRRFGYYLYRDGLKVKDTANMGGYTTMVAVWTNTFTLKFDGNGATKGSMKDQEIVYGVPTSITHVGFEKAGYAFLGWHAKRDDGKGYCYTNSAKTKRAWSSKETCRRFSYYLYKDGLKVKDTANIGGYTTMVAVWTNTYILKFDGNGATRGSMKDQELVYGIRTKIRRNEFKKTGYAFDGWHAERSDGKWYCYTDSTKKKHSWSTKSTCEKYDYYLYKNEMNVTNTAEPGSYTTLHAKWSKAKCTQYECPKGSTSKGGECFETNISFSKVSKVKDCVCPAYTTKHAGECFTTETKNVWVKKINGNCPSGAVKHGGECFKKETREVHVNKTCSQVCPKGTEEHGGICYKKTTKDVHVNKVCTKYSS